MFKALGAGLSLASAAVVVLASIGAVQIALFVVETSGATGGSMTVAQAAAPHTLRWG
jgi:hypothetical protein